MKELINDEMGFDETLYEFRMDERFRVVRVQSIEDRLPRLLEEIKDFLVMTGFSRDLVDKIEYNED